MHEALPTLAMGRHASGGGASGTTQRHWWSAAEGWALPRRRAAVEGGGSGAELGMGVASGGSGSGHLQP
jgi:hypothetical protein